MSEQPEVAGTSGGAESRVAPKPPATGVESTNPSERGSLATGPRGPSHLDTPASRSAADRGRHRTTVNMARSLLPLLALIVVGVWLLQARGDSSASSSSQFRTAQSRAGTALPQPRGLEPGWRDIGESADVPAKGEVGPVTWTVRFHAPDGKLAEAVISTRSLPATLHAVAPSVGATTDTVLAGGRRWAEYRTRSGAPVLGTSIGRLSAAVSGSESLDGLVTLAGSLR